MNRFKQLIIEALANQFEGGVYIAVNVDPNNAVIKEIQSQVNRYFNLAIDINNLHCTLIYSANNHSSIKVADLDVDPERVFQANIKEIKVWEGHEDNKYLGIILDSPELVNENNRLMKFGFTSDFDSYMPHVTLQSKTNISPNDDRLKSINDYFKNSNYTLTLSGEYVEALNKNWGE